MSRLVHRFLSSMFRLQSGILIQARQPPTYISIRRLYTSELFRPLTLYCIPYRWKSKGKGKSKPIPKSKDQLPTELLELIRADEMNLQFEAALTRFQSALQTRLALKLTPQMLADVQVPEARAKLGEIANLVSQHDNQTSKQTVGTSASGTNQQLLIDLASRPELISAARKAVTNFLESTGRGSSALIQTAGQTAFTVRLRTVVTREAREELINKGDEMLKHLKREMDRIYQAHDKLIPNTPETKKHYSEDDLFAARDYLRAVVKQNHSLASTMWEKKQTELRGN